MIRLLHILLFISLPFIAISQNIKGDDLKIKEKSRLIGQVTIGSKSFDNSAILTLTATDKGLLIPRLTTAERDAIGSPSTGLLIFNTTTNKFEFFETTWQAITDGGDMIGANNLSDVSNATTSYNNIKQQGTTTFIGAWESGTVAEINIGTDVTKLVTVDGLAGSQLQTDVTTNNAKVTNATHTGDVTGSGVLTIAAKAVEISMLDDGTDGELITWDATGVAATVSTGTSGQVLTSNGAGAAPTFQTDGGDGNGIYDGSGSLSANPTTVAQAANKLQFTSSIVDGFSIDGTTFSIDASNNRVGIGTAAPISTFNVKGGTTILEGVNAASNTDALLVEDNVGTDLFRVPNDGNVAIGTAPNINHKLAVGGQLRVIGSSIQLSFKNTSGGVDEKVADFMVTGTTFLGRLVNDAESAGTNWIQVNRSGFAVSSVTFLNGNFGVGTIAPTQKFMVVGNSQFSGTVGINTTPISVSKLTIDHNPTSNRALTLTSNSTSESNESLQIINTNSTGVSHAQLSIISDNGNVNGQMFTQGASAGSFASNTVNFRALGSSNPDFTWITGGAERMRLTTGGDVGIGVSAPTEKLEVNGNVKISGGFSTDATLSTLGVGVTTFSTSSNVMTITGDGGANTIATITGALSGQYLILIFVDALVTITDDNGHTSDTIDLSAAFTSSDDAILHLVYNGTSWYEISRSTN